MDVSAVVIEFFEKVDCIAAIIGKDGEIKRVNSYGRRMGLNEGMKLIKRPGVKLFEIPESNILICGSTIEDNGNLILVGTKVNYGELLEALPIPSLLLDEDKTILDANKEFLKKYNYDESIKNKRLNEIARLEGEKATILDPGGESYSAYMKIVNLLQPGLYLALVFEEDLNPIFIHQFKNVLQSLMIQVYFVKQLIKSFPEGVKSEFEVEKFLQLFEKIDNQLRVLERLTSLFHALYRKPIKEEVSVSNVIKEVISSMSIPDNIQVSISFEDDLKMKLDFFLLMNALMNIIENSINAMPKGGKLDITMNKTESNLIIKISDTGEGMSKEVLEKLFTPHFTTKKKGTGLGLYIARKIIEKHDGKIMVESEQGKGTTFSIILPLK